MTQRASPVGTWQQRPLAERSASRSTSVSIDGLTRTAHRSTPEAFPAASPRPSATRAASPARSRAAPLHDRTTLIFASLQFAHRDVSDGRPVPRPSSAGRIATRIHKAHLHTARGCSEAALNAWPPLPLYSHHRVPLGSGLVRRRVHCDQHTVSAF